MILLVLASCGARTGPHEDGDSELGAGGLGGGSAQPLGACTECDGSVVCTHCYVQAYDTTYRCQPGQPMPEPSCMGLGELHVDQYGRSYTCYYCP